MNSTPNDGATGPRVFRETHSKTDELRRRGNEQRVDFEPPLTERYTVKSCVLPMVMSTMWIS